mmetsp:Transcript_4763/g.13027  ORF Transcript_4763/g.13027 Transcript_4763/m.13027 type:complete len:280 (-) Transcript_4763:363-1202(-)
MRSSSSSRARLAASISTRTFSYSRSASALRSALRAASSASRSRTMVQWSSRFCSSALSLASRARLAASCCSKNCAMKAFVSCTLAARKVASALFSSAMRATTWSTIARSRIACSSAILSRSWRSAICSSSTSRALMAIAFRFASASASCAAAAASERCTYKLNVVSYSCCCAFSCALSLNCSARSLLTLAVRIFSASALSSSLCSRSCCTSLWLLSTSCCLLANTVANRSSSSALKSASSLLRSAWYIASSIWASCCLSLACRPILLMSSRKGSPALWS